MASESVQFSDELIAWARLAGYTLAEDDTAEDPVLWSDPGGEIRYTLRADGDWFVLSRADRASQEGFVLAATAVQTIDRHLFDTFGADIRGAKKLPWLKVPTRREEVAPGYDIVEQPDGFVQLVTPHDEPVARCLGGRLGIMNLVVLSHLFDSSFATIESSYLDPSGRPLFPQSLS